MSWPLLAAVVVAGAGGAVGQRAILAALRKLPAWILASSNVGSAALTAAAGVTLLSQPLTGAAWAGLAAIVAGGIVAATTTNANQGLPVVATSRELRASG